MVGEVEAHLEKLRRLDERVDYLTFVPNGEPTLDINLGRTIRALAPFGVKIGVITNSSLLSREDVRADLAEADWVSVKIDAAVERVWRAINRPHSGLTLSSLIRGLVRFSESFPGELHTETMLVRDLNDQSSYIEKLADIISTLKPRRAYLGIPVRPPAEKWVTPSTGEVLSEWRKVLEAKAPSVEILTARDDEEFTGTGSPDRDLPAVMAVHPMKAKEVERFLERAGADWALIDRLLESGAIMRLEFEGQRFYRKSPDQRDEYGCADDQ